MNALNFWFYFVLFGSGCGFVSVIVLIAKSVRNRPKRKMISSVGMTWDDFEKELSYKQITKGITAERLSEICAAEREGQCVILPCKAGEKVYYIAFTMQFGYYGVLDGYHGVLDGFEHVVVIKQFEYSDIEKFGISVFLTKEQAESKLAEMKGE